MPMLTAAQTELIHRITSPDDLGSGPLNGPSGSRPA